MSANGNSNNLSEEHGFLPVDPEFATIAIHSGYNPKEHPSGCVVPPIALSTTFEQDGPGDHRVS